VTGYDRFCRLSDSDVEKDGDMAYNTVIRAWLRGQIREGGRFLMYSEPLGWRFDPHIQCEEGDKTNFTPQLGH